MKIYDIEQSALKYYLDHVRNGRDATIDTVRRKLSALIASTDYIEKNMNLVVYSISNFRIYVRNRTIVSVLWTNKYTIVSPDMHRKIKSNYKQVGLDRYGNERVAI